MERKAEGTHMVFMRHIMEKKARREADGIWETPKEEVFQEAAGTQSEMTYIRRKQGTVS